MNPTRTQTFGYLPWISASTCKDAQVFEKTQLIPPKRARECVILPNIHVNIL
jgi:hypothetical protein